MFDLLVDMIGKARSITDEEKEEWIRKLETEGLPATTQRALLALFKHEAELLKTLTANAKRLIVSQQQQMRIAERESMERGQLLLDEHDESVKGIISDCHENCAAEERNCGRAIEGFKRKKDDDQANAIRNALKQGDAPDA